MRAALALIGLGVAGGTVPTGLAGMAHVAPVVGGAVVALTLLVGACVAAPALVRRLSAPRESAAPKVALLRPAPAVRARGI
jgi:hypothetical protein